MKIAFDPHMHRHLPLIETVRLAAELSPRPDFLAWWSRFMRSEMQKYIDTYFK